MHKSLTALLLLGCSSACVLAQTFDAVTVRSLNKTRYADQYPSIQAAIDDTPAGGTLKIPVGTYVLSGGGSQLVLIQKQITIEGDGWGSVLQVPPSVSNATDIIRVNGSSSTLFGIVFRNFSILPSSGTPARYGINFDATNGSNVIGGFEIDHVQIGQLGVAAVAAFGPNPPTFDGVFTSTIANSYLTGGIDLEHAGDSLDLHHNTIPGKGSVTINLVGVGSNTAHGFLFIANNVTCTGGIHLMNAWGGVIAYNNIELYTGSTGSNGAVLDLDGNSSIPPEDFQVVGNFLGGVGLTGIRVNQMVATYIAQNMLPRGGGPTIVITPLADRTQIVANRTQPAGELISTWLNDQGTHTMVDYLHPNTGQRTVTAQMDFQAGISINDGPPLTSTAQTGSGSIVMSTYPTLDSPFINGSITLNEQSVTPNASAGNANPLPRAPAGYIVLNIGNQLIKIPFFNY